MPSEQGLVLFAVGQLGNLHHHYLLAGLRGTKGPSKVVPCLFLEPYARLLSTIGENCPRFATTLQKK